MSKFAKISKLDNTDGFLQIDYFKGNKYIDKAGEFLNTLYESKTETPSFTMNPLGAEIALEKGKKRIEVSNNKLWTAYTNPDSLEVQKQFFTKVFDNATKLFEPFSYSRLGWRNYFVTEQSLEKTVFFDKSRWYDGDFRELYIEKEFGKIKSNVRISKVKNTITQAEGLMFDIDLYRHFNDEKDTSVIKQSLNEIATCFSSDELLKLINDTLQDVGK